MVDQEHSIQEHSIVVGIDGSAGSKSALRWALAQARLTGAKVEAVAAWQDPYLYGYGYGLAGLATRRRRDRRRR